MIRRTLVLAPTLAGALALAACGGSGNDTQSAAAPAPYGGSQATAPTTPAPAPAAGVGAIALAADPNGALTFDTTALQAKAGNVTIDFTNASSVPHGLAIEAPSGDVKTKVITSGKATLMTTLKPGTYEFYCPVPGHKQAGMKGTLTVS